MLGLDVEPKMAIKRVLFAMNDYDILKIDFQEKICKNYQRNSTHIYNMK